MIKCNSFHAYSETCVACMDAQQSLGGTITCDVAEDLDFDEESILHICQYAEKVATKN